MSYIIWKNKNSNDISGLIISELSPISKPKMRTNVTEIDGLDGDIVDYLGYKSYNKSVSIGLTKNYDIDEIIAYFNGSGKLVLSNELDKYYNAQIIDSIDYNRLINFKKAIVKFYVQPYKFLLNESSYILEIATETSLSVLNKGLEKSKPIITLYGTGEIEILINGNSIFSVNMGTDEYITIDSEKEEAYKGAVLKNRQMLGSFPELNPGTNVISWVGNLTKIEVAPRSRWL